MFTIAVHAFADAVARAMKKVFAISGAVDNPRAALSLASPAAVFLLPPTTGSDTAVACFANYIEHFRVLVRHASCSETPST